jgi:hypothetical protein
MSAEAIFPVDEEHIRDNRLRTLTKAASVWRTTALCDRKEKLDLAHELHKEGLFSLNQLAKIVRLPVPTIARAMKKNSPGGRFQPEALSSLTYIRRVVLEGNKIPMQLVRTLVKEGTSVTEISRMTGAPETSMYLFVKNTK